MRFTQSLWKITKEGVGEITKREANLPESYVRRTLQSVEWSTPKGYVQYLPKKIVHKKNHYDTSKPWTTRFQRMNEPGKRYPKVFLEPIKDWSFFKGDRVEILVGPDKGKQGIILDVIEERNWVLVEGLNTKLMTTGKTAKTPGNPIIVEQPLLVNHEVALVDPSDLNSTRVEWRYTEEGEKVRVSVRTGRIIPVPVTSFETHDYKTKKGYKESVKDTTEDELTKITFDPALCTFEMDIMKSEGIEENRIPKKTYWY